MCKGNIYLIFAEEYFLRGNLRFFPVKLYKENETHLLIIV